MSGASFYSKISCPVQHFCRSFVFRRFCEVDLITVSVVCMYVAHYDPSIRRSFYFIPFELISSLLEFDFSR